MIKFKFPTDLNCAMMQILRVIPETLDISIQNSSHFGGEMISDAWIRLSNSQINELIKDIDLYLGGKAITRKIYEMPPKFGYRSAVSVEVSDYTDNELEIIINNGSRLFSGCVNETFVRLDKHGAAMIHDTLIELLSD